MEETTQVVISLDDETTSDTMPKKSSSPPSQSEAPSAGENDAHKRNQDPVDDEKFTWFEAVLAVVIVIIIVIVLLALVVLMTPIIAIPVLSLMLPFYLIALIVQLFRPDDDSNKMRHFMGSFARWMWVCFGLISIDLLLCMLVFGVTPSLKHRKLNGVSITRWIGVSVIICFSFTYSLFTRYFLGYRRLKREDSLEKAHLDEGFIGAISNALYLFALFLVIRVVPILKEYTILSLQTQKWVRMILLVMIGHHVICICTASIVVSVRNKYILKKSKDLLNSRPQRGVAGKMIHLFTGLGSKRKWFRQRFKELFNIGTDQWNKYVVYYAEGLRRSFNFVLTSLLVLLTWVLYFGSRLNRSSSEIRGVYDFGFWTFLCILVSAFLWLVKSGIVLSWEARVVYNRFNKKIFDAANHLYLIGMIAGPKFDILGVWKKREGDDQEEGEEEEEEEIRYEPEADEVRSCGENDQINAQSEQRSDQGVGNIGLDVRARNIARKILAGNQNEDLPYTSDIVRMARYFMAAEKPMSKDGYVLDFVAMWQKENLKWKNSTSNGRICNLLGRALDKEDSDLFEKKLKDEKVGDKIITDSEKWIVKYHNVCLELGRTIAGAMEVVNCLNNIMIVVLVAAVIIVWLLLTEIATTKVLILVASPIVGASFIFGESCKTLFQGIMFTYVVHPFDVGDLCTINGIQLEVKRIGVWKTIFSKVGTTDDVVYPNTILANTSIVNHTGEGDPNGYVELRLNSTTKLDQIKRLKTKIEEYLNTNDDGFKTHSNGVVVKDIGKNILVAVHFRYNEAAIKAMMSIDGLRKKSERRHAFLLQMKTLMEELDIKEAKSSSLVELRLNSTTKTEQIVQLKTKIEEYLANNDDGLRTHPDGVLVKDIGKTITIAVHYGYDDSSVQAMMSTDGLQKKSQKRHVFLLRMKTFLDELDIKEDTKAKSS